MKENLNQHRESILSQSVMLALIKKGMMRQEAYELVQEAVMNNDFPSKLESFGFSEEELKELRKTRKNEEILFERALALING